MKSFFNITQDNSLQPRTLLNSMTDDFIRVFEVAAPKTLENCKINLCSGVPDVVEPTTRLYYR